MSMRTLRSGLFDYALAYALGLESKAALHLLQQKKNLTPPCSDANFDIFSSTTMPQTGSFAKALVEQLV
jgi:hypothetical protein